MFPDCVTETKVNGKTTYEIDFEKLKEFLSSKIVDDKKETYEFSWPDKKISKLSVNERTTNTLRPIKEKSIDFDNTKNLYIEGDNLEVLKVLRDTYFGKIDVIYIDPPYNTGNDFIYKDNFAKSNAQADLESGNLDEEGNRMVANKLENGRYHTDWLNMIYPRLLLAKDLLSDSGVIFISIDDHEYANLKKICDDIFGEQKFVANLIWRKKNTGGGSDSKTIESETEYILCYAIKNEKTFKGKKIDSENFPLKDDNYEKYGGYNLTDLDRVCSDKSFKYQESLDYEILAPDGSYFKNYRNIIKPKSYCYTLGKKLFDFCNANGFIEIKKNKDGHWRAFRKSYEKVTIDRKLMKIIDRESGNSYSNLISPYLDNTELSNLFLIDDGKITTSRGTSDIKKLFNDKIFNYAKPVSLVKMILSTISKTDSLILDFFSGSATTAHSAMQLNKEDDGKRKWIMIQVPEKVGNDSTAFSNNFHTICDIGTERIKRAGEIIKKENPNVDTGFRYLKIDTSNIKENTTPADKQTQMNLDHLIESIKSDRSELDLVFEIMLAKKITLDTPIQEQIILDKKIYNVNNNFLICCFDDNLSEDFIKEVAKLSPIYLVFKESSFANDQIITPSEELIKVFSNQKTECEII